MGRHTTGADDPGPFAAATAVAPAGDGAFTAEVHDGWDIGGNANGGYLLAIAARALCAATDRPDPVTITAHYLSPAKPGALRLETDVVRSGRTFSTARATMLADDGRAILTTLGTFGDLSDRDGPQHIDGEPPDLPDPEQCRSMRPPGPSPAPNFAEQVESLLHPDDTAWVQGTRSGQALLRGWMRLPHGEQVDPLALLLFVDAFPPTIFNVDLPVGWTPTVELTAHVRARPAPGWLRCRFSTRFVTGGFLEEDGEVWDSTGALVAQSRQLALVPRG